MMNVHLPPSRSSLFIALLRDILFSINNSCFLASLLRIAVLIGWGYWCSCDCWHCLQGHYTNYIMESSDTCSDVRESDSLVAFLSTSTGMLSHFSTERKVWASSTISVFVEIRNWIPCTGFAPSFTRFSQPKPGTAASTLPRSNPLRQTLSPPHLQHPS